MVFEGRGLKAIAPTLAGKSNEQLEALLEGGLTLQVESANPALARLGGVTECHYRPSSPGTPDAGLSFFAEDKGAKSASDTVVPEHWTRLVVVPGLEIHVRSGFALSGTPQEREKIIRHLTTALEQLAVIARQRKH
jgi:hypothetical protein